MLIYLWICGIGIIWLAALSIVCFAFVLQISSMETAPKSWCDYLEMLESIVKAGRTG
jgi:hypothetical protein